MNIANNINKMGFRIRSEKNIILVASNLKEVANNIQNVVPVKSYDGKRSKNATLINLATYLIHRFAFAEDIR